MKHSDKDKMFSLCAEIVKQVGLLSKEKILEENEMSPLTVVEATTSFFSSEIETFKTRYKREKQLKKNKFYVAPEEKAIGTRIELIYDKKEQIEKPTLIQSTFQKVSIISTLQAFFNNPENMEMYLNHQAEHRCKQNIFECFCCGQVFKSEEFFHLNPDAIQLQLAIDDVEICDPLSSKNNLHKLCAVYLVIRNIPHRFNSKLNNIFLVCLCNVDDLKTKKTDINNIWETIVDEIKFLEDTGIKLSNGRYLKGTLVCLAADNLGANVALCLSESFRSFHYCIICTLNSGECKKTFEDDLRKYRNSSHYEKMLEIVENSESVDYKETCGVKRYCALNDLKYFDIFKNISVDPMHDLNEGIVRFLLNCLFLYLIKNKVFTEDELKNMVKFYQYPKQFRRDKPSNLNFNRQSLGQNATQMKCLFLNLPFILTKYENNIHLKKVWNCVQWLLRIFHIVYSEKVDEVMLKELEECVSNHLKSFKTHFGVDLIPKHHFIVHYANIVRMVGPLIHSSMIRFDAKHTVFKQFVRNTNNFVNINKTLAIKHQQCLAASENTFRDKITHSKEKKVDLGLIKSNFNNSIVSHVLNSSTVFEHDSFSFNSYRYERNSIISYKKELYEIEMILFTDSKPHFVAVKLEFVGVHDFSQGLEVRKPNLSSCVFSLIKFDNLSYKKPYCCKFMNKKQFVIIDNRDIIKTLEK